MYEFFSKNATFAYIAKVTMKSYKYNGKELVSDEGLNWNDYLARVYDPALLIFTTMAPMAEKYYSISPYAYCLNNPLKHIDPTGMDIWEIDKEGNIRNRIEDKTQDAFFMVAKDSDGNYQRTYTLDADGNKVYNSISFEYGTVEFQRTIDINSTGSYDVYQVRGDENGTQMFEFMSQNTEVEWSQAKTGIAGDKGLNFLTTSHEGKDERGMGNLYKKQLYAKYTIRELIHNHPGNTAKASRNDQHFSNIITRYSRAKKLNIPLFKIYLPNSKSYMNY